MVCVHIQQMPNSLSFSDWYESFTHFLKSASSLSMSSLDNLLLSCRYRGEKRALLSSVPEASLNNGLEKSNKKNGIWHILLNKCVRINHLLNQFN